MYGSRPQQTNPFPVRSSRHTRRASPYLPNPSTHARKPPICPDSTTSAVASGTLPSAQTTACTAPQSEIIEFKTALRAMKANLDSLPPVKSAIDGLEGCVAHMQIQEQTRKGYEDIVSDLTNLAHVVRTHVVEKKPSHVPRSIANAARAIVEQTKSIWGCQNTDSTSECLRGIRKIFQQLEADISFSIWDGPQEEQRDVRLKALCSVSDAYHNAAISSSVTKRTGCTEGTRVELLETIQTWIGDEDGAKIYWLNGMAGTGKTTIAYSVCDMLQKKYQLGGSFFCSRNSPGCRDVNRIIPTIAYQLARYSNPYRKVLCDVLGDDPEAAKRNISAQFKQLILEPLMKTGKALPTDVVVVIDALDECTDVDGTREVLKILLQYASDLPLNFFISSRPEPEISDYMVARGGAVRSIMWLHDIEQSLVQADIRIYLAEALAYAKLSSSEIDQLAAQAGCLFIFAATAVRYILPSKGSANRRERLRVILGLQPNQSNRSHQEVDELYATILSNALDETVYEESELRARRHALWTVMCAQEPLSVAALGEILDMPDAETVQLVIQPLQSVLYVSEGTNAISALHASFPDFLLNEQRAGQYHCNGVAHHSYLAECCFRVMGRSLKFNICDIESSYEFDEDIPDLQRRIDQHISTGLFYSCRYWGDHLTKNQSTPSSLLLLEAFLQRHLLFWMEVMNLKGIIGHGESVLSQALGWLQTQNNNPTLWDFTYDARNFLTSFAGNPTSLSTPHIYISTLPFTSSRDLVYRTYWPRTQGLIRLEGIGMEVRGKSELATRDLGNELPGYSLALSKDGKRVVTGSFSNEVSVWEVASGTRIQGPLEDGAESEDGEEFANSAAYSPDNTRIASGSSDGIIRIWLAQTGELVAGPLDNHNDIIRSIVFSPDGARLASGSDDKTIRIWDAHSGAPVGEPLEGHWGAVMSIAFSPDGRHLASGSFDSTIRVWDWQKSAVAQGQLEGHTAAVYSVAYSRDGHRLASGSEDRTVRVWDMSNGTLLASPFEGHTDCVSSVAFSPNGTRVVSGSYDKTIRVWEVVSGALLAGPFEGHGGMVSSVLFTADGTRILSGSEDGTIRVWDVRHRTTGTTESSGHTEIIRSVALSPDGTRIASGSDDKTIRVWNAHNGALVAGPFIGHTGVVNSVSFSPDGARIVSGSYDRTLRTWDASTGAVLVGPIEGHTSLVRSVAFSPSGGQIASGSDDYTIRLWNSHTGAPVAEPFAGHTFIIMSIAYSPNGVRIVSGSYDKTVRMWDANDSTALWTSNAHTSYVGCVAFSPDGTRVVSGSDDNAILVLDAADGAVLHGPFTGHTDQVASVAFSPDGTRVASVSNDQTVRVWDVEGSATGIGPLKAHTWGVGSVAFSPTGAHIISGAYDHTIRVWDLAAISHAGLSNNWFIDGGGWLTTSQSQRLFWVPLDLRRGFGFLTASNPIVINAPCTTHIDPSTLLGDRWHECYGTPSAAVPS